MLQELHVLSFWGQKREKKKLAGEKAELKSGTHVLLHLQGFTH